MLPKRQEPRREFTEASGKEKIIMFILGVVVIITIAVIYYFRETAPREEMIPFRKEGELDFIDASGNVKARIDIEIADTEYDRQKGLMFRKTLGNKQGMLFEFPIQDMLSFWMKNTYLTLDILFVNSNREIVTIHKRTQPLSENSYAADAPAIYVVEVVGGFTDANNIQVGDKIKWGVIYNP
ncbi:MAG: hypothetical protein C0425_10720 [Chlorobiaceae bacterium]|nr:hypothetical protein [Chlorobiaceae bacterium]MBA4310789.1 hypothetical protein [Chlorobiaceae bacterium]